MTTYEYTAMNLTPENMEHAAEVSSMPLDELKEQVEFLRRTFPGPRVYMVTKTPVDSEEAPLFLAMSEPTMRRGFSFPKGEIKNEFVKVVKL